MRADRLLSILMLLQARGRMTATELAVELEVCERTIYRDIEALSMAGVPVYSERGPGGGCALLDSYRTTLTGLTRDEARALLLLSIPEPLSALGVGTELQAALRKVFAALPADTRLGDAPGQRIHLDWAGWGLGRQPQASLQVIYQALVANLILRISYPMANGVLIERVVAPVGLVGKAGLWYLVYAADGKIDSVAIDGLRNLQVLEERCQPPPDFDLAAWWKESSAAIETRRVRYCARVIALPVVAQDLAHRYGLPGELQPGEVIDPQAPVELELFFDSLETARDRLLGYGRAVRVISPAALRLSIQDFANQVAGLYAQEPGAGG